MALQSQSKSTLFQRPFFTRFNVDRGDVSFGMTVSANLPADIIDDLHNALGIASDASLVNVISKTPEKGRPVAVTTTDRKRKLFCCFKISIELPPISTDAEPEIATAEIYYRIDSPTKPHGLVNMQMSPANDSEEQKHITEVLETEVRPRKQRAKRKKIGGTPAKDVYIRNGEVTDDKDGSSAPRKRLRHWSHKFPAVLANTDQGQGDDTSKENRHPSTAGANLGVYHWTEAATRHLLDQFQTACKLSISTHYMTSEDEIPLMVTRTLSRISSAGGDRELTYYEDPLSEDYPPESAFDVSARTIASIVFRTPFKGETTALDTATEDIEYDDEAMPSVAKALDFSPAV